MGDRALRMVARELSGCVRDGDGVCRFGGDEFFVVLSGVAPDDVSNIAARVRQAIEKNKITLRDGRQASISVSIGNSYVESADGATPEDIQNSADKNLFEQKMEARVRVDLG